MPTLTWVGKDKVVNHHHDVPFRVLKTEKTFHAPKGAPANSADNRIIHGDNLEALKSLLPEFEGKVKCIYIDPPYNTGNEGWVYNDAVNDPKMQKWLGDVVGKEGEDLSRHDKWLCMMYPRLILLKKLLANDGVIFISIDDDECHTLRLMLDEIFGRAARLATFTWRTEGNFDNQAKIKNCHEYVLMYSKNPDGFPHPPVVDPNVPLTSKLYKPVIRNTIVKNGPKNPVTSFVLKKGFPADFESGLIKKTADSWPQYESNCTIENYKTTNDVVVKSGWSSLDLLDSFVKSEFKPVLDTKGQETIFKIINTGAIESIKTRINPSHVITSLSNLGSTQNTSSQLKEMGIAFSYPKPMEFVSYLISMIDIEEDKEFIILDSFAGSGTTAHAALSLNAKDGGNRQFILVEMMDYAETITAERVRRVMSGYGEGDNHIKGLGGRFTYQTIGEPLFLPDDNLNEAVGVEAIRNYVTWTESIPASEQTKPSNLHTPYLLGINPDTAWIFYYETECATCLDMDFLATLKFGGKTGMAKPGTVIIYADRCLLSKEFMTKHGIIFKKIPRDITRF